MIARFLPLLVALVVVSAGCASKQKAPYRTQSQGRDYYSANKQSVNFLFGTFRKNRALYREKRNRMWGPGELRSENAAVRKQSVAFLWDALAAGEAESWKSAWTEQFPEMLRGPDDFGASVRFGLLDSGD